jgi:hypothetical protein
MWPGPTGELDQHLVLLISPASTRCTRARRPGFVRPSGYISTPGIPEAELPRLDRCATDPPGGPAWAEVSLVRLASTRCTIRPVLAAYQHHEMLPRR